MARLVKYIVRWAGLVRGAWLVTHSVLVVRGARGVRVNPTLLIIAGFSLARLVSCTLWGQVKNIARSAGLVTVARVVTYAVWVVRVVRVNLTLVITIGVS